MPYPFPHTILPDVTCITPQLLAAHGIQGLLLDIDGTLMQSRDAMPAPPVLAWMQQMQQSGVRLYILSNNRHEARVKAFAEKTGLLWRHHAHKPSPDGFRRAAEELGLPLSRLAVVGDQIFTDVWGARRCGCYALMVQSTDTYLWYFPFRRLAELPFRRERN